LSAPRLRADQLDVDAHPAMSAARIAASRCLRSVLFMRQSPAVIAVPPLLRCGGSAGHGRGMAAMESWQRVAADVRGGIAQGCGHWVPEERPAWVVERLLAFFGEVQA